MASICLHPPPLAGRGSCRPDTTVKWGYGGRGAQQHPPTAPRPFSLPGPQAVLSQSTRTPLLGRRAELASASVAGGPGRGRSDCQPCPPRVLRPLRGAVQRRACLPLTPCWRRAAGGPDMARGPQHSGEMPPRGLALLGAWAAGSLKVADESSRRDEVGPRALSSAATSCRVHGARGPC